MIEAALKRNQHFVNAGIARFIEADFESIKFEEERFDKILAMRVRLFFDKPEEAKKLAKPWLAPGGKIFVQYDEPK